MGKSIKTTVQRFFFSFFSKLIPELKLLNDDNIYWPYHRSLVIRSKIGKQIKFYPPYKISDTEIAEGTYIASNSVISLSQIGKYCSIGPNFLCGWGIHPVNGLSTAPMFYSTLKQNGKTLSKHDKIEERKKITIGNDVFIGANVTVLDGITIGDGAIIGAGAVVSKDIPPYAVAVGCPIKIIRFRFSDENIRSLLRIKWWEFGEQKLQDVEKYFFEIETFIRKYDEQKNRE
ncbi:MAG: chloramphenicol acetyltransferase [Sphingobacteriales bacterium UTBCD1]|jgi:acetyltransferase-like isoleucine patch superfamily enzyme|nr:MAG: chloramphenicol acetyltransferase [Sphingobacteriales bacterium UTBCD1]